MAITRRTARFEELAGDIEVECIHRGMQVAPELVDQVLNARIHIVAEHLRIGDRAALHYCPDDLAPRLAHHLVAALRELPSADVDQTDVDDADVDQPNFVQDSAGAVVVDLDERRRRG